MELLGISNTDIFSATIQQTAQLESLANGALSKGIDLYMRQDYEGAIKEFRRSVGLAPNSTYSTNATTYMANAYLALGDTDGAVKAYEAALKRSPNRDDIYISLGNIHFSGDQYDKAVKAYEKAVKIWPSSDNHYALGQAYLNAGQHSEADREFNTVLRMDPDKPNGNYGLGLNFSRQGRYEDAILQFKQAIRIDPKFYDGYAELGYAFADFGEMEEARRVADTLEHVAPDLVDTLSRYMYKVDSPKITYAPAESTFGYSLTNNTSLAALDAYLANADASKSFSMIFQFDKQMDRESVENQLNWQISRSAQSGPGQTYNFNLPVPETEVNVHPIPENIYWDETKMTATVTFRITQNSTANGTIDPAHIEFKFSGKDVYGNSMDADFDQYIGFSGTA